MRTLFFLTFILLFYNGFSQQSVPFFSIIGNDTTSVHIQDIIETDRYEYILCGDKKKVNGNNEESVFLASLYKINNLGTIIGQFEHALKDSSCLMYDMVQFGENIYAISSAASTFDTHAPDVIFLYNFNYNLELLERIKIQTDLNIKNIYELYLSAGFGDDLFCYGFCKTQTGNTGSFVIKLKKDGTVLSSRFMENIKLKKDLVLFDDIFIIPQEAGCSLIKFNYDNLSDIEIYEDNDGFYCSIEGASIEQLSDSTLAYSAYNLWENTSKLAIIDSAFNVLQTNFDINNDSGFGGQNIQRKALDINNQNKIFVATHFPAPIDSYYLSVTKTDSDLDLLWEKFLNFEYPVFYLNLISCSDGGCLIAGYNYENRNTHLVKLNSGGDNIAKSKEKRLDNASELILYPNPGNAELNVRTAVQALSGEFILYDTNGKLLQQCTINRREQEINTSKIPTGQYIWKYQKPDGTQESGIWIKQ